MASGWYNRGVYEVVVQGTDLLNHPLQWMLLQSTYAFDRDQATVSELVSHELTASGYARVDLTVPILTLNPTNDASYLDADNPVFGPLAAGQTIGFVVVFRNTGSDSTSPLLMCWQVVPEPTDGSEYEFKISASGLSKFWSAT
jgi:hypothetical protein